MIIFLRAKENMGGEKKIDEERDRRASIFFPINPLKVNTLRFDSIATRWRYDISIPGLITRFSCSLFMPKLRPGI